MNDADNEHSKSTIGSRQRKTEMRPETALFVAASWSGLITPKLRPFVKMSTSTTGGIEWLDALVNEKSNELPT